MFTPHTGPALWGYIFGTLVVSGIIFFALTLVPGRGRKPLIASITFLAGLFFAAEFFLPVGDKGENFLTPLLKPASDATTLLQTFALGIGVYSLVSLHLRNVARQKGGWGFSALLIGGIFAMLIPELLKSYHPNRYNAGAVSIVFNGAFNSLNSTMFSIVAFYIVSAAYRAFRIRSVEATILLVSAFLVMLGRVALGQAMTSWIPNDGFIANLRFENIGSWIMTRVNSPAVQAVDFGLGIGGLATALRLWLSLERGSYFDSEV